MAERLKAAVLKTAVRVAHRRFESYLLRQSAFHNAGEMAE